MQRISFNALCNGYEFPNGGSITSEDIKARLLNGKMDWVKLVTKPNKMEYFAANVPLSIRNLAVDHSIGFRDYANRDGDGVEHDQGDFILCPTMFGEMQKRDMQVVNGLSFPFEYNLSSFKGMFKNVKDMKAHVPKSIFS